MNYGLSSDDPEELANYNKTRKEMDEIKKDPIKKGITLYWNIAKEIENVSKYFLINRRESDAYWSANAYDF